MTDIDSLRKFFEEIDAKRLAAFIEVFSGLENGKVRIRPPSGIPHQAELYSPFYKNSNFYTKEDLDKLNNSLPLSPSDFDRYPPLITVDSSPAIKITPILSPYHLNTMTEEVCMEVARRHFKPIKLTYYPAECDFYGNNVKINPSTDLKLSKQWNKISK